MVSGHTLSDGTVTNTWDSANRLAAVSQADAALVNHYDGLGNRVASTQDGQRTDYALDVAAGLPEVVYSSDGNKYLHLPGVIMTENASGEVRYLLSDGLGSIRHATDVNGAVVGYHEFDPYGNPLADSEDSYGFTGEWWQADIGLLHLRARWYDPQSGTFLSVDPVESEPPYQYVRGNVVNRTDPSGNAPPPPKPVPVPPERTPEPFPYTPLDEYPLVALHKFFHSRYDKRALGMRCDVNGDGLYNELDDDGPQKTDGVYEIFRDFVCEYGPEFRQYDEQDNLTQRFKKSEGIRQIREEFYENGATHLIKYRSFNVVEVYEATVDIPWDRLASHMIGSYKAQVDRTGNHVRFQVDNPMTRESGSRIPGRHGNNKITYDDILE